MTPRDAVHRLLLTCALALAACGGDDDGGSAGGDASPPADAASDGAPVDAAPPAFSPADLPGLAIWLDGDEGVVSPLDMVIGWNDRSPNDNDAANTDGLSRPQVAPDPINGHQAIRFDGENDLLVVVDAPSLQWGIGDFLVALVVRYPAASVATECMFNKQELAAPFDGVFVHRNASGRIAGKISSDEPVVVVDAVAGQPHLIVYRRRDDVLLLAVDGISESVVTEINVDVGAPGIHLQLGGRNDDEVEQQFFAGDIAEVVAVGGPTSVEDAAALASYLADKFGIELAP